MARIVGITIASMMPSELNRICRSAEAMGPFGSSTPSEQPPSVAAPNRTIGEHSAYQTSSALTVTGAMMSWEDGDPACSDSEVQPKG